MYRIRPIRDSDYSALRELAFQAQLGMTNLPKNPEALQELQKKGISSFQANIKAPGDHYYLFVLEESEKQQILGVSAIYAQTGITIPLNYFQIKHASPLRLFPEVPDTMNILERVQYRNAPTEICSLFLTHDARKLGLGKLLSFSRFLFMSAFPERFCDTVFADMRGVIDRNGHCPFWEAVGRHFLNIDFKELMARRDRGQNDIPSLMPIYPLYIDLLPKDAVSVIGETHPNTRPAVAMLLQQGFVKTSDVDLFDAGPRLIAKREEIQAIKKSVFSTVTKIVEMLPGEQVVILSNNKLDFRALIGKIAFEIEKGCVIERSTAQALEISIGDPLIHLPYE